MFLGIPGRVATYDRLCATLAMVDVRRVPIASQPGVHLRPRIIHPLDACVGDWCWSPSALADDRSTGRGGGLTLRDATHLRRVRGGRTRNGKWAYLPFGANGP